MSIHKLSATALVTALAMGGLVRPYRRARPGRSRTAPRCTAITRTASGALALMTTPAAGPWRPSNAATRSIEPTAVSTGTATVSPARSAKREPGPIVPPGLPLRGYFQH